MRKFLEFANAMPEGNLIHLYDDAGELVYGEKPNPGDFPWPELPATRTDMFLDVQYSGRPF